MQRNASRSLGLPLNFPQAETSCVVAFAAFALYALGTGAGGPIYDGVKSHGSPASLHMHMPMMYRIISHSGCISTDSYSSPAVSEKRQENATRSTNANNDANLYSNGTKAKSNNIQNNRVSRARRVTTVLATTCHGHR